MMMIRRVVVFGVVCAALSACATTYIKPTTTSNPPPRENFASFHAFVLLPVELAASYQASEANQKAVGRIQENLSRSLTPVLAAWKRDGAPGRTLEIGRAHV